MAEDENPVVGWLTREDGSHEPVRRDFADALWAAAEAEQAKRATNMPTEQDAINQMHDAYLRLKELGWNDPMYETRPDVERDIMEAGSTGIFKGHYSGEWPTGSWWVCDGGDIWPSRPTLVRKLSTPPPQGEK